MKILHVDMGKEWRGGQRQCALLHQGLLHRGIESILLCNSTGELARRGLQNVITTGFHGEVSPLSIANFNRVIKEVKPDIIHSHEASSLTPLLILRAFGKDYKLINTRRVDFSVKKNPISLYKYKNKYVHIVAISEGVKKILVKDGISPDNIDIIYSGTPTPAKPSEAEVAKAKQELGLNDADIVLGTVANFSPHKDIPTMLKAYAIYTSKFPKTKLLMVGDGPLMGMVRAEAYRLAIRDRVVFTGFRTDIPTMMSCMDIFVVSSKEEGLNTSIIDAMHLARPVVATNAGGIGELVTDGVTGLLVEPQDYIALADKLEKLSADIELRKKFGDNAVEKASAFTDNVMVDKYGSFYGRLMA
jgi:glycosyltransferase involved in cell wall biosynthesis